jgi:hypothetical protein
MHFADCKRYVLRVLDRAGKLRGLSAYKGMIKLITKLGSVSLEIAAEPKADKLEAIAGLALQNLIFHKAPSTAYKKGSGLKRDDAYSDTLRDGVASAVKDALSPFFDDVSVVAGERVAKVDPVAAERRKAYDAMLSLSPELAATMYPEFVEAPAETEAEVSLS